MPELLPKWVRVKLADKKLKPLPTLPPKRPRALTPSPSQELLPYLPATTNIGFFQWFPFEIRRQILVEAFGGQTVHMDLCFDHPPQPWKEKHRQNRPTHCDINLYHCPPLTPRLDKSKPKQWQWWSSVCHGPASLLLGHVLADDLHADDCRKGEGNFCELWPGEMPGKCFIGVMGWLLTSKQAYAEGTDVLYSTNHIHMASVVMVQHLPQLLLPQRLASIRSVALALNLDASQDCAKRHDLPKFGLSTYRSLLGELPLILRNLRKLNISLVGSLIPPGMGYAAFLDASETIFMTPLDGLVRQLGQLEEFNVALPASLYRHQKEKATGDPMIYRPRSPRKGRRIWRELPCPEKGNDGLTTANLPGYWVKCGQFDITAADVYHIFSDDF